MADRTDVSVVPVTQRLRELAGERPRGISTRKPTSHDLIFKTACRYFFGDVVELTRPELARRLDLSEVEFIEQEAFSDFPEGERSVADLVAKVRLKDGVERESNKERPPAAGRPHPRCRLERGPRHPQGRARDIPEVVRRRRGAAEQRR